MKITELLKPGAVVSLTLHRDVALAAFAGQTAEYATIEDVSEHGILFEPHLHGVVDESGHQQERRGVPVFVAWQHIYCVRAHPSPNG